MQAILECKQCGGQLSPEENQKIVYCKFCGSANAISVADRFGLYNRANYLRRQNEFDRAMGIYEDIIKEDHTDAEAYFGMALCKYGIEYVDDPETDKKVPTCHRTRFTLMSQDEDFKKAIEYADSDTLSVYMEEATKIDIILKKIQQLSSKQEKYDIFICYKESDGAGGRTQSSVLAQDIYEHLTNKGYKTFFARKTLESKLGSDYEPIIFSALYSAKVMLVIGTKPEEFQAVWVRNEWVRFMERISNADECTLIPLYRDMSPYELPNELANIQALDMGKIGYIQDLLDGIGKLIKKSSPEGAAISGVAAGTIEGSVNVSGLKKRAFLFLEQGDFKSASQYFERVLDQSPEDSESYWGKLLAKLECHNEEELENTSVPIKEMQNFQMAMRFGTDEQNEKYQRYSDLIDSKLYEEAKRREEEARQKAERERLEAEKQERLAQLQKAEEEKRRKEQAERDKLYRKKLIKGAVKAIIGLILYLFIGQFIVMGVGNGILKMTHNYIGAKNYTAFCKTIPLVNNVQKLPIFENIIEICEKEPDYEKLISKWENEDAVNNSTGISVSINDGFCHVAVNGNKVDFYQRRYDPNIECWIIAKQLHDIRNDGKKIEDFYLSSNRMQLFILYKNGTVKCVGTDSITSDKYGYIKKSDTFDYSGVEKWKDIVDIKCDPRFVYGLKKNGKIVKWEYSDDLAAFYDGEFSSWDEIKAWN